MRVLGDGFHDSAPIQVEWTFGVLDVAGVEPLLDTFEALDGDGVDVSRGAVEVLEDEDHIEILQAKLDTFEVGDFDLLKRDHCERWLGQLYQAVGSGLHEDVRAVGNTTKAQVAERYVYGDALVGASACDLVGKVLELLIESYPTSTFLLLLFKFLLIMLSVLALAISRLVELHIGSLSVELNVLRFFLPDHDGIFEMNVNDNDQLVLARLEEQMLDIAEEQIDVVSTMITVSKTILMDLDLARDTLTIHSRTYEHIIKSSWLAI